MGEVRVGTLEPVASRLLSALQWLAIGGVLGGITISAGPLSAVYLGGLIWAYAARRGRDASDDPLVRRWWMWAAALSLLSAACSFAGWFTDAAGIVGQCLGVALIVVIIWCLHLATGERDMPVSASWRRLGIAAVPSAALAVSAAVIALVSGEPRDPGSAGSYMRIGSAELTLSGTAQWVVLALLVPLLLTCVWSLVLFVRTYRTLNAAARHWERLRHGEPVDGTI